MKITVNTGGLQVNFADMIKDVKLIYTNVGNTPFLVDFVDPAGENKTTVVPPAGRYTISSNDGNPTGGRLTFHTESGQTYMVVSKVQEDSTVDGVDEKGYLSGTASKDDVTALKTKTQNQSATSGNTSFTGNLTVSGTISTGSMSDIAGKVSQNQSAISGIQSEIPGIQADVATLALSKLPYGTLYFNKGKLFGSNFTIPNFPFSICAQVRIDGWKGASDVSQSIFQCGTYGSTQLVSLAFSDTSSFPRLGVQVSSTSGGTTTSSAFRCNFDYSDFIGKDHTIVAVCRNLDSSDTLDWSIYLDGEAMTGSPTKDLKIDALGGSVNYAVNTTNGNFPSNAACANPMRLSRLAVFNFDMSADGAPYTVADYVSGRLIPPSLIGNQFTGMYGSGWSVTGDTATCSGSSANTYLRVTDGSIPIGFDYEFTVDLDLTFSGDATLEVYTLCSKAVAEIYNYADGSTVKKNSASGGGFYGNASLGITSSGHYKITFKCQDFLGGDSSFGQIQLVIGALTQGTVILSDTNYDRAFLALENYTIARNATTTLVKDASGNSNDATVQVSDSGTVAGDNDQSIKAFIDEIKTQINQANG